MGNQYFSRLGIRLTLALAMFGLSSELFAGGAGLSGLDSFRSRGAVDRDYVQALIAERRSLVLDEAQLREAMTKLEEAKASVRGALAKRYLEEILSGGANHDHNDLLRLELSERGYPDWVYEALEQQRLFSHQAELLGSEMGVDEMDVREPQRVSAEVFEAARAVAESSRARKEIAVLEALLQGEEQTPPPPPAHRINYKVTKKGGLVGRDAAADRIAEDMIRKAAQALQRRRSQDSNAQVPDRISELMQEMAFENGEIVEEQAAEEAIVKEAVESLGLVVETLNSHLGDADRLAAEIRAARLQELAEMDPELLKDPRIYQIRNNRDFVRELLLREIDHLPAHRLMELMEPQRGRESSHALEIIQRELPSAELLRRLQDLTPSDRIDMRSK